MIDIKDAEATVEGELLDAIAETCGFTGLTPGHSSDELIRAIIKRIKDPAVRWAFHVLSREVL